MKRIKGKKGEGKGRMRGSRLKVDSLGSEKWGCGGTGVSSE